jgi:hypothetical protein
MIDDGSNPGATGRSFTLLAVSQTSKPTGKWNVFLLDVTDDGQNGTPNHSGCPCLGDQPLIGADAYGFYISTNEFGNSFNGAQVYAISKTALEKTSDIGDVQVVSIDASQYLSPFGGLSYSIQPATSPSFNDFDRDRNGTEYFLSALEFGYPPYQLLDNRIATWALTNTKSLNSSAPNLQLNVQVIASEVYGLPNSADQKAGPTPLGTALGDALQQVQTNDDRMNQVVYAHGTLYSGLNTILGNGTNTGIAWFMVHPDWKRNSLNSKIENQGYISVAGNNVIFPSFGVTSSGKGAVVFTLVGKDYYPSAAYATVNSDGVSNVIRIAGSGVGPQDGFSGYWQYGGSAARWGDYSAAVADGGNIWMAAEYIPGGTRTALANWGTFVAKISVGDN